MQVVANAILGMVSRTDHIPPFSPSSRCGVPNNTCAWPLTYSNFDPSGYLASTQSIAVSLCYYFSRGLLS